MAAEFKRGLPPGATIHTMESGQAAIDDPSWQQELGTLLEADLALYAEPGGRRCGSLWAKLKVQKSPDDGLTVLDRFVYLTNVETTGVRNNGIGSGLLEEMEKHARQFGASRIEAIISPFDFVATPSLPVFYEHRGYQLTPADNGGFTMIKPL
jgi:GNAT superfamily N-acetyltransferase